MTEDIRIEQIDDLIAKGDLIFDIIDANPKRFPLTSFNLWLADITQFFLDNFETNNAYFVYFRQNVMTGQDPNTPYPNPEHVSLGIETLKALGRYLMKNPENLKNKRFDAIEKLEMISDNFHLVARQMRDRRENRSTLEIDDEYDVQDLFHSLLWLFFDDIRSEEYSPSYAGGSSKIDFLIKKEKIAVETKMTRRGNRNEDNRVGQELLVDIDRYKEHPDCQSLVCFFYDPEGRIGNPSGVTADLMKKNTSELRVHVFIRPTGH